ncbi:hypothetical protein AAFF_G00109520 [Aldrovandia affinis]|uniref:Uncharacterized protein n=1 Tax=Aldrovandia affinis TaxID=143900 RepID=A0AAD7RU64_9TELE|nr:hypothetical protein AAFF_G00109520 [Aldrovandia affinis]
MPGEEIRQRKGGARSKKAKSKGKGRQGSSSSAVDRLGVSADGQELPFCPELSSVLPPMKAVEEKAKTAKAKVEEESFAAICLQVLFPYLLAGMGMVMAARAGAEILVRLAARAAQCTSGEMGDRSGSSVASPKQQATNKSKLGASLLTLCRRTWMLLRAGGRKGFERSPSAARLVASEA